MTIKDEAVKVRQGEELNIEAVEKFIKENIPDLCGSLEVEQYPGGFSNLTYLVKLKDSVSGMTREMVLRRPPIGAKIKSAHDMVREYRILSSIYPVFPYCPKPLACSEDESIMGCSFYVMEKISGIILRKDIPSGLDFSPAQVRQLCEKLVDLHLDLHAIDVKATGLDFIGKPQGYVERQVKGWSERYRKAKTPDAPDFETVISWLEDKKQPDTDRPALIHNDYKFDNVVLHPDVMLPADMSKNSDKPVEIIGVLDWEMATCGDPLMDLGSSLAYWVEKDDPPESQALRSMPTYIDGAMTRREIVERYGQKSGRDMENFDFYYCFGLFRLAVIAQQIYKRFHQGFTKDKRFGMLVFAVKLLENMALKVMEQSKL
ncbi:MAG: phosphotransferase family protein [Desulfamplus sp.]|nr:phosphotransferase family protein [Desulfamplus sp.]